jgi:hypothetical protein
VWVLLYFLFVLFRFLHRGCLGNGYDKSVAFWNFLAAGNYAGRCYHYAMQEVNNVIDRVHAQIVKDKASNERDVMAMLALSSSSSGADSVNAAAVKAQVIEKITAFTNTKGDYILSEWQDLLPRLITRYHDGMIATHLDAPTIVMRKLFYPKWWLNATGYFEHSGTFGENTILFAPAPEGSSSMFSSVVLTAVGSSFVTLLAVMYVVHRNKQGNNNQYMAIPTVQL